MSAAPPAQAEDAKNPWKQTLLKCLSALAPLPALFTDPAPSGPPLKNIQQSHSVQGHMLTFKGSVQVDVSRFQDVRLVASYWTDYADRSTEARINLYGED
jgi:hypothetical protein